jgi:[ribosomal protein S18]-alanine N-acetyltransferase
VTRPLKIEGSWPQPVTLRRGWSKARARPWNGVSDLSYLRLLRGGSDFITDATAWLEAQAGNPTLSPALYSSATSAWTGAGYEPCLELKIMEKILGDPGSMPPTVAVDSRPDLDELAALDRDAFDTFWHMDREGLEEAIGSTAAGATLVASDEYGTIGYAIVGTQLATAFLQRIAVSPRRQREGWGTSLVEAAITWSSRRGAASMILNVRQENQTAIDLYFRAGFVDTGNNLHVLGHGVTGGIA